LAVLAQTAVHATGSQSTMTKPLRTPLSALPLLLMLLAGTQGASAEDLLDIYDLAVKSDPALRESEQTLFATREVKPQARALLLPDFRLSGDVDYTDVETSGNNSFGSFNRSDSFSSYGAAAVLSQSVYNRADWVRLSQSDNTIAQAEAEYRNDQIDLMVRTTRAYF
jgi:outer membrane protein